MTNLMKKNDLNEIVNYAKRLFAQRSWVLLVLLFASVVSIHAQQTTGSIVGTVKDPTGAVVGAATVKATNVETGFSRSAPTNSYGEYRIDYLPVGGYTVELEAPGFRRFVQQNLVLNVDQTLAVEITLTVGATTETITITDAPPVINTSDAVLGRTVEGAEILGLPLVNRNAYSEISLTPGVMANNNSPTSNPTGSPNFTVGLPSADVQINGSIDGGNPEVAFYLDGGNNITGMRNYGNPAPNPDALEEFRVETSAFGAQYGQFSAAVITVITKSGTNKFHGSLFEFNRNTDFNAYPWTAGQGAAAIKLPYHRNQFGGTVGGPIKHDKAFFFFSYGGLRQVAGSQLTGGIVPTAAERLGDFTADTFTVYNPKPANVTALVWNVPANQAKGVNTSPNCHVATLNCLNTAQLDTTIANFDNVSNTFGSSIPLPNGAAKPATGGGAYTGVYNTPTTANEYLGKYDQVLGDKDHVTVTFFFVRNVQGNNPGGNVPWTINQSAANQWNANISDVHTFSPSTANQFWLTFTRAAGGRVNLPVSGPASQTLATYGSNFAIQGPNALPSWSPSGAFTATTTNAGPFTGSDNYELRDMVSLTKGKHTLSIGGEVALDKTMFWADLLNFGTIGFATSAPTSTNNVFSDWVTGNASSFEQDTPYTTLLSYWHTAVFLQDNYRVTPRFTANLGIRWDIDTPPVESLNRTASFSPGVQSTVTPVAPKGLLFVGDKGVGRGIISTKFHHISPRVGLAWDPWGDGKTAFRGAAGVFYGTTSGNEWNQPGNGAPFAIRQTFGPLGGANNSGVNGITNIYATPGDFPSSGSGGGIFPYTFSPSAPTFFPSAAVESIGTNVQYPYIYQFNVSVQRQLPAQISMTVAYVGTLSHNVPTMIDGNYSPYSTAFGTPSTSATSIANRRQFDPCVGPCPTGPAGINTGTMGQNILLITNQHANYNGLQVSAKKQLSRGFTISGFYVWSHALQSSNESAIGQMTAQDFGYLGGAFTGTNNTLGALGGGLSEEKGPMDANRSSNAVISGIWNINYFHGSSMFLKQALNGWQIAPVVYMTSGAPLNMTTGSTKNSDSSGSNRPNAVPGVNPKLSHGCRICSVNSELTAWFNTAAFTNNGPGLPGGIGPGGADGNVTRDSITGPGFRDMDLGVFRNITFEHGVVFQFRAEATNALNWVSVGNPTTSLSSGNDAKITGAQGTQRVIQLGGRLTF
jgi:Carboxypeptidase regulatory-like domain